jgi:hypothetical protein
LSSQLAWLLPLLFLGYVYWRRSRSERTLRRSASFRVVPRRSKI